VYGEVLYVRLTAVLTKITHVYGSWFRKKSITTPSVFKFQRDFGQELWHVHEKIGFLRLLR
jgi:hypothetical protein